jgi:hypothetical protein
VLHADTILPDDALTVDDRLCFGEPTQVVHRGSNAFYLGL